MSMRYTYVAHHLPENKMRIHPTKIINILGGPGSQKSLFSAAIILYLTLHGKSVELLPDYARSLVWQKDYPALRNQFLIAEQQYHMQELLDGQIQFLVTENALPQLMFYNEHYEDNICDVAKTSDCIRQWYGQFNNVNILVQRDEKPYVQTGRFQKEEQAREVDVGIRELLEREEWSFTELKPAVTEIHAFTASLLKD